MREKGLDTAWADAAARRILDVVSDVGFVRHPALFEVAQLLVSAGPGAEWVRGT
jgi:hypothetical protein